MRKAPDSGAGARVLVLHEAIDNFRDDKGKIVGMDVMAMPFSVREDLDLGTFKPGDKIRFEFSDSREGPRMLITNIELLDPKTELKLKGYSVKMENSAA